MNNEISKVTKDPKKVEAGKKGYQVKLLKLKKQIMQEGGTSGDTATNLISTSSTTGTNSSTNLISTSGILLGCVGVLVIGAYFYMKPGRQTVQLSEKNKVDRSHRPMF